MPYRCAKALGPLWASFGRHGARWDHKGTPLGRRIRGPEGGGGVVGWSPKLDFSKLCGTASCKESKVIIPRKEVTPARPPEASFFVSGVFKCLFQVPWVYQKNMERFYFKIVWARMCPKQKEEHVFGDVVGSPVVPFGYCCTVHRED